MGAAGGRAARLGADPENGELIHAPGGRFRRAARAEEPRQWQPKVPAN